MVEGYRQKELPSNKFLFSSLIDQESMHVREANIPTEAQIRKERDSHEIQLKERCCYELMDTMGLHSSNVELDSVHMGCCIGLYKFILVLFTSRFWNNGRPVVTANLVLLLLDSMYSLV